jgi:hypothetical protein
VNGRNPDRVDDNQSGVVKALRRRGAMVVDLSGVGGGVVTDLLVGFRGSWLAVEVCRRPRGSAEN